VGNKPGGPVREDIVKAPFIDIDFARAAVEVDGRPDGGCVLRSPQRLHAYARCLGDLLEHWGRTTPDAVFLAERDGAGGWRTVGFAEALDAARRIGQALLDRGLSPERPVMLLSGNSVNHALLTLGAMHVGVPAAPISPAYSLMSQDHEKVRYIAEQLKPGLVYCETGAPFAEACAAADLGEAEIVCADAGIDGRACTGFDALLATRPGEDVDRAFRRVTPETIAKILYTSGSTAQPKGVINTHRMLCSNQQAMSQIWPFLAERPPVMVDWLPWNHTFGGNFNFNMVLQHGGTLYIDAGKPMPGLVETTVRNLSEVGPTLYFNVPRGFDMLIPHLQENDRLRETFFSRLQIVFYAGASLPASLWEKLEDLSVRTLGKRVPMVSAWGSTETSPMVTCVHFPIERAGVIGLPAPGSELKMVPNAGKMELRVRGPNVTPGYWKNPKLTEEAFDAEGFYRIGDAGRFDDEGDPAKGIVFDGRIAEDFKLMSGTWVNVGTVRVDLISACAPVVQDAVVTGHDREEVGALLFVSPPACAKIADAPADTPLAELVRRPEVRAVVERGLAQLAADDRGSARRVTRALLLEEPPSIDANEITDKGYINQRAVLQRRADLVARLYDEAGDPQVIRVAGATAAA
jgi:feruloyl-CoA synthase